MTDKQFKRVERLAEVGAVLIIFAVVALFVMGVIVLGRVAFG
jgi:hypothetical protein